MTQYDISSLALDPVVNFGKVTVSTGYTTETAIALLTGHGTRLPDPSPLVDGPFNLVWYNSSQYADPADDPNVEIVRCTIKAVDSIVIIRGQENTSISNKNSVGDTYKMILTPTKKMFTDIPIDTQSRVNTSIGTHATLTTGVHGTGAGYVAIAVGSQYTAINKAGDTMTGSLNLPVNGLVVGTNQLVTSGGNVGIGTTNTQNVKLRIFGNSALNNNNALYWRNFADSGYSIGIYSTPSDDLRVITGGIDNRLTILSDGNVGIGTTIPATRLEIAGGNLLLGNSSQIFWRNSAGIHDQALRIYGSSANNLILTASAVSERQVRPISCILIQVEALN